MSLEPLNEDRVDQLDPLDGICPTFDYDDLATRLGEPASESADTLADAAVAWKAVLQFCLRGNPKDPRYAKGAGLRLIALGWVIAPELLGAPSLTQLAAWQGCSAANLSPFASAFSKLFGVKSRAQCRGPGNRQGKSKNEQPAQN